MYCYVRVSPALWYRVLSITKNNGLSVEECLSGLLEKAGEALPATPVPEVVALRDQDQQCVLQLVTLLESREGMLSRSQAKRLLGWPSRRFDRVVEMGAAEGRFVLSGRLLALPGRGVQGASPQEQMRIEKIVGLLLQQPTATMGELAACLSLGDMATRKLVQKMVDNQTLVYDDSLREPGTFGRTKFRYRLNRGE